MKPEILISILLKEGIEKGYDEIKYISDLVKSLKDQGIDTAGISLRTRPGGYYSEEIEGFVGQLLLWGYAKQSSPIVLTEKGEKILSENIIEVLGSNSAELKEIRDIINNLSKRAA